MRPPKFIRRATLKILAIVAALLIAGVAINIAVAWGLVLRGPTTLIHGAPSPWIDDAAWPAPPPAGWPPLGRRFPPVFSGIGYRHYEMSFHPETDRQYLARATDAGWPLRSLVAVEFWELDGRANELDYAIGRCCCPICAVTAHVSPSSPFPSPSRPIPSSTPRSPAGCSRVWGR